MWQRRDAERVGRKRQRSILPNAVKNTSTHKQTHPVRQALVFCHSRRVRGLAAVSESGQARLRAREGLVGGGHQRE
jgi:hypothetical protein